MAVNLLRFVGDALLASYAHILFSRSRAVGALLMCATLASPRLFVAGVCGVLGSLVIARAMQLSDELVRSGAFSYNALLVALGCAAFLEPSPVTTVLIALSVAWSVVLTAALRSAMSAAFALPVLSLPFLLVLYLALSSTASLDIGWVATSPFLDSAPATGWLATGRSYLEALGAIFFTPHVLSGVCVWLALVVHSRIGFLLSFVGFSVATAVAGLATGIPAPGFTQVLGFNGILVALALGGVWFVPSVTSTVLAVGAVLGASLLGIALYPLCVALGLPLLIVPFNLTVIVVLYAMRHRVQDLSPKSVDFAIGSPEANLTYYQTRIARFGNRYAVRFSAPFRGRWVCTQGVDGAMTHRGPWRHALDFEVADNAGRLFKGDGDEPTDYFCYGLPVLAPASGTVARVVDGVPDNAIGGNDLDQNWGNLVVLYHAPGLYSLLCHLAPGSIKVREGQVITAGSVLGACGNSGRSPVPHLHFQLQATAHVGAATLPIELNAVVAEGDTGPPRFWDVVVPSEGTVVRNLQPEPELEALLDFRQGAELTLVHADGSEPETLTPDIDVFGRRVLTSADRRATLYYIHSPGLFCVLDTVGSRRSALHLVQMALGRLPFELSDDLEWTDFLPIRRLLPAAAAPLFDLVSMFLPGLGLEVSYRTERAAGGLVVLGHSTQTAPDGRPRLETVAHLSEGGGLERIEVRVGRRQHAVTVSSSLHIQSRPRTSPAGHLTQLRGLT